MRISRIVLITFVSVMMCSSVTTFASFNSDYKDFIIEAVKHVPAKNSFDPNVMSGSLMVSYETTEPEKMSVDAVIAFAGQIDETSKNISVNLSVSGSYATHSGTQFIDTAGRSIVIPDQGGVSKFYVTLDHLKSNVPQLQETQIQSVINKLTTNWYVGTGDTSESLGIDKTLSKGSFIPSIAGDNIDAQIRFYQQIIKYPIITPIGSQDTNSIYKVRLNKRNTAQILTLLASSQEPKMTISERNKMRVAHMRSMSSLQSQGTFDPINGRIKLNLTQKGEKTSLDITPQSIAMVTKTKTTSAKAQLAWDRDRISVAASGSIEEGSFTAYMMANQSHVEISGTYSDETSEGKVKLFIDTASTQVSIVEPEDALPMSDLSL